MPAVKPAVHHMPAAISLDLLHLRRDITAVEGFHAKFAVALTRMVGTMWAFWVFNGVALVSLPSAIHQGSLTVLVNWVSSNWIQLILLPALMVGQNLQNAAGDARQEALAGHMDLVVDRLNPHTEGGLKAVLDAIAQIPGHTP
jgi:hypothetical protein